MTEFDWRPNIVIGEDLMAAPAPDAAYDCRSVGYLHAEARQASAAKSPEAPALWKAYWAKREAMMALRDAARESNGLIAADFAARIGKIRGVTVESAEVDDFARIELRMVVDGRRFWTRPVSAGNLDKGYKLLRDAVAALRRDDYTRWRRWLSTEAVWRRVATWDGYDQVRFGENEYGAKWWPK